MHNQSRGKTNILDLVKLIGLSKTCVMDSQFSQSGQIPVFSTNLFGLFLEN